MFNLEWLKINGRGRLAETVQPQTVGDKTLYKMRICTNYRVKDKSGEYINATNWITAIMWRDIPAHILNGLTQGARVSFSGELFIKQYTTREGSTGTSIEVLLDDLVPDIVERKTTEPKSNVQATTQNQPQNTTTVIPTDQAYDEGFGNSQWPTGD